MKAKILVQKKKFSMFKKITSDFKERVAACKDLSALKKLFFIFMNISGSTLIEIALYVALVVIVCIGVITALGDKLQGVFDTIVGSL